MIANPRPGRPVQAWYRRQVANRMPHHGQVGAVVVASRGPGPRNHLIDFAGRLVVVPCGNLRDPKGDGPR